MRTYRILKDPYKEKYWVQIFDVAQDKWRDLVNERFASLVAAKECINATIVFNAGPKEVWRQIG